MALRRALAGWIEERTGLIGAGRRFLTEDIPGGASYWYVFGSATLFALIVQVLTGILLTLYYAPSAATAWESTKYIYTQVPLGSFLISLHYWGASAMIALVVLHVLQVIVWGAYKRPREAQWIIGVVLLGLTFLMGLTGYLLPWDLNAYFASAVTINIAGSVPVVGPAIQALLQDGATIGTLTINRFFGIHIWLTPLALIAITVLHLVVFRHNGGAGRWRQTAAPAPGSVRAFWPKQIYMDTLAAAAICAAIVVLAIASPAPFDVKADPNRLNFQPYPAWYFLALFGLLNMLPPQLELVATVVVPTIIAALLVLLPWLDRSPSRAPSRRPWVLGGTALVLLGAVVLSVQAQASIDARRAATGAAASMMAVVPSASSPKISRGSTVYTTNCIGCHQANGQGVAATFPPLASNPFVVGEPAKVARVVLFGLTGPLQVNGHTFNSQMPAWKDSLSDEDIAEVITFVRASWGNAGGSVSASIVHTARVSPGAAK